MRVLQINAVANSGSTGRITEEIGNVLLACGHESYIAYGRGKATSTSKLLKIGSPKDVYWHGAYTLFTDKHGFASKNATEKFIEEVDNIKPDLIALYNLHGYYIHLPILFGYINKYNIPTVWTLFDCWAFTGHCTYFDDIQCKKWETQCVSCPKNRNYPSSLIDNSFRNFEEKKKLFTAVKNMELITHSNWLAELVKYSFLKDYKVNITPSAINLDLFRPVSSELRNNFNLGNSKIILGCANIWTNRKGYDDFLMLSELLSDEYKIVMIGLNQKELKSLPQKILGLQKTESIEELAEWYSLAFVFVNPTTQDNFPTTNLEALACGTPVITYNTGGSIEAIDASTGFVVEKGDIHGILKAIERLNMLDYNKISLDCRKRAESFYDKKIRYMDYINVFERILKIKP